MMNQLWHKSLAIGIEEIDAQHRELFFRVDSLLAACKAGQGREEVTGLIDYLQDYVITHFAQEEEVQKRHSYPHFAEHRAAHMEFIRTVGELKFRLAEQGPSMSFIVAVNKTVTDWLRLHIGRSDRELGRFLAAQKEDLL